MVNISVLIATKNEEKNLRNCLSAISNWANEIVIIDSQSTDNTVKIAEEFNVKVHQFFYKGGWPKKRQWALDNLNFKNDWILILDADEILLDPIKNEICNAINNNDYHGYWLKFRIYFLGRLLRYGDTTLYKLFLFRKGFGNYEIRMAEQTTDMSDIEVHEHLIVNGKTKKLRNPIKHENFNDLSRYIIKHNEYSNWESELFYSKNNKIEFNGIFRNQHKRRRLLKILFLKLFASPMIFLFYKYIIKGGFLDGKPGFYYHIFHFIQLIHVKAKIYEKSLKPKG